MKLLIVEDEAKIAEFMKTGLKDDMYEADIAPNAEEALEMMKTGMYEAYIVDVMLPGMDGIALCAKMRESGVTYPILMLTARGEVQDKIKGLDSGADDYLTKPFVFEELTARLRALIRKSKGYARLILEVGDLKIDPNDKFVQRDGRVINLSKKEYQLLEYLVKNKDRLVTRAMIAKSVWENDGTTFTNIIDVFVAHLRKKVDADSTTKLIHTVRSKGFMLSESEPESAGQ